MRCNCWWNDNVYFCLWILKMAQFSLCGVFHNNTFCFKTCIVACAKKMFDSMNSPDIRAFYRVIFLFNQLSTMALNPLQNKKKMYATEKNVVWWTIYQSIKMSLISHSRVLAVPVVKKCLFNPFVTKTLKIR